MPDELTDDRLDEMIECCLQFEPGDMLKAFLALRAARQRERELRDKIERIEQSVIARRCGAIGDEAFFINVSKWLADSGKAVTP